MNEPVVTVVGNMTGDPELRYVSSGIPVASFTVASTPRTLNRQTNQWEDGEAVFVRCSVWREYAENVAESLTKGMRVVVTGRMTVRSYEHNGERRTSIELQVDEVGPSLRYARAQITRVTSSGQASSQGGSFPTNQDRPDGNAYSTPPIGSGDPTQNHNQHDPWAKPDAFTDLPPF